LTQPGHRWLLPRHAPEHQDPAPLRFDGGDHGAAQCGPV